MTLVALSLVFPFTWTAQQRTTLPNIPVFWQTDAKSSKLKI